MTVMDTALRGSGTGAVAHAPFPVPDPHGGQQT